jgi:Flp pilus assembly pilin Flp
MVMRRHDLSLWLYGMNTLRRQIRRFFKTADGVTVVEYAVMLAMIVLVAIVAIRNAGTSHREFWLNTADEIETMTEASESF